MDKAFDLFFDSMMAWNQLGLLFAGALMLSVGALFFIYMIYRYKTCVPVKGRISAIRMTGKSETPTAEAYRAQQIKEQEEKSPVEQVLSEKKSSRIGAFLFVLLMVGLPLLFVVVGGWFAYDYYHLSTTGVETQAKIVRYHESYDSESGTSYYAVVSYRDQRGQQHEARDRISSKPEKRGETVAIYYDPEDFGHIAIAGFAHNMILPMAFIGMGGLFLFIMLGGANRLAERVKQPSSIGGKSRDPMADINISGEMYYPVYEYKAPNGERIEVRSRDGSNLLLSKLPGKAVRLLVNRNDPLDAKPLRFKLSIILGLIFFVPGAVMVYIALTRFELTAASFGIGGAFLFFLLWKGRKLFKRVRRDKPLSRNAFSERMREKRDTELQKGRLLTAHEIRLRIRKRDRYRSYWIPVLTLLAAGLIIGAYYVAQDTNEFLLTAAPAQGQVVRVEGRASSSSDGGYVYYPVISYRVPDENDGYRDYKFISKTGTNPPLYQVGDKVKVLYDPHSPYDARIDRGLLNWLLPGGMGLAGLLIFLSTLKMAAGIRNRKGRF